MCGLQEELQKRLGIEEKIVHYYVLIRLSMN
ncbi:unknown [[Mannheimia] succiniciproducens MBEL55E]|uniref:Uncharacterized protein n=1 Tax=Mannheimia succiniciproducens (strain KCTC 0769BP / MBEL55E) TaxID=221988 RepID=Q65WQ1_MANSM|nr:unknown [[Mannheimia] succiniciproducens MBEL55E]